MKPKINNSCVKLRKQLFSTTIFQRVTDFRYTKSQSIYLHYPSGQEPESWRGCENFHNYRIVGNNTFHFTVKYRFHFLYSIALKLPINSQVFPLQFRTNGFRSDILDPAVRWLNRESDRLMDPYWTVLVFTVYGSPFREFCQSKNSYGMKQ